MRMACTAKFFLAAVFLISAAYASGANRSEAEYVSGTIKSIPLHTVGTLDLNDPNDLVFRYGRNFYRLPFDQIKSYEVGSARPARRAVAHVPVPSMPWKHDQILNLSFRAGNDDIGVVSLKLTGKDLSNAEWALKSRVNSTNGSASIGGRPKLPESWWGDRYWRTSRNSAAWPSTDPEAAGTK